jgi:heat shock protein HslJ
MRVVSHLVAAALLAACSGGGLAEADVAGSWLLEEAVGGGAPVDLADGVRVTLVLDEDGTVSGTAACNSYGGDYDLVDGSFRLSDEVSMTAMGCAPPVMEAERAFTEALAIVSEATLEDGELVLAGEPDTLLRFVHLADVEGSDVAGRWSIVALGEDGSSEPASGDPFVEFGEAGAMAGSTGCRDLSGRYVVEGGEILMTEMRADGECDEALASQDGHVVEVLGDGFVPERTGDSLTLVSRDEVTLTLEPR